MKKLLVAIAAVLVSASVYAQLTPAVQFNNRIPGIVNAPVFRPDGTTGAGAGISAELVLIGAGGSVTVLTPRTVFRTDLPTTTAEEPFVVPVDVPIPGGTAGQQVQLRMRAFEGTSYDTSLLRNESAIVTVTLKDPALPPADLAGLQGFNLQVIPEPSTIALGILGAAALLLRRRK